jgi:ferredoxin
MTPYVAYDLCAGCGGCAELFPELFEMRQEQAWVAHHEWFRDDMAMRVVACCPFHAITVE